MPERFHKILKEIIEGNRPMLTDETFTVAQIRVLKRVMDLTDLENKQYFENQIQPRVYGNTIEQ